MGFNSGFKGLITLYIQFIYCGILSIEEQNTLHSTEVTRTVM